MTGDWQGTLDIRIIPVIADAKQQTRDYVETLNQQHFEDIERYLIAQAEPFGLNLKNSLDIRLEPSIEDNPPTVPKNNSSLFEVTLWSLKLRWWAWRNELDDHHIAQIRLYVLYQSPSNNQPLPHSTGLQNGLLGLINARAFENQEGLHQIVIVHELLHIFGATDKYDFSTGEPFYPQGFAQPNQSPLHPQSKAKIMARAMQIDDKKLEVATSLNRIIIGPITAQEIGWLSAE